MIAGVRRSASGRQTASIIEEADMIPAISYRSKRCRHPGRTGTMATGNLGRCTASSYEPNAIIPFSKPLDGLSRGIVIYSPIFGPFLHYVIGQSCPVIRTDGIDTEMPQGDRYYFRRRPHRSHAVFLQKSARHAHDGQVAGLPITRTTRAHATPLEAPS